MLVIYRCCSNDITGGQPFSGLSTKEWLFPRVLKSYNFYVPFWCPLLLVLVFPPDAALRPWLEVLPVSPLRVEGLLLLLLLTRVLFASF